MQVILLCFGVIMGSYMPKEVWNYSQGRTDYTTISGEYYSNMSCKSRFECDQTFNRAVRSRSLLSLDYHQTNCQNLACDWFHHIFVKEVSTPPLSNRIEDVSCRKTYFSTSPTSVLPNEEHIQILTPAPSCHNRTCTT